MGRSSSSGFGSGPSRFTSGSSIGSFGVGGGAGAFDDINSIAPPKEKRPTFGDLDTGMFDTPAAAGEGATIDEDDDDGDELDL